MDQLSGVLTALIGMACCVGLLIPIAVLAVMSNSSGRRRGSSYFHGGSGGYGRHGGSDGGSDGFGSGSSSCGGGSSSSCGGGSSSSCGGGSSG